MPTCWIHPREVAEPIFEALAQEVKKRTERGLRRPRLEIFLSKEDPNNPYARALQRDCKRLDIDCEVHHFTSAGSLCGTLKVEANRNWCDGAIIIRPKPEEKTLRPVYYGSYLREEVDSDCIKATNLGFLMAGNFDQIPATVEAVLLLLKHYKISYQQHYAIIGRSLSVGMPLAAALTNKDATVSLLHSKSLDSTKEAVLCLAQVIISAAGCTTVTSKLPVAGKVLINIGQHYEDGEKVNDISEMTLQMCKAAIPYNESIGPLTRACLLKNVCLSAGCSVPAECAIT